MSCTARRRIQRVIRVGLGAASGLRGICDDPFFGLE